MTLPFLDRGSAILDWSAIASRRDEEAADDSVVDSLCDLLLAKDEAQKTRRAVSIAPFDVG